MPERIIRDSVNTSQHTPTPWRADKQRFGEVMIYPAKDPYNQRGLIARLEFGKVGERHADGAFIVVAVNAHDELLVALTALADAAEAYMHYHAEKFYDGEVQPTGLHPQIRAARAVIAKATGS